MYRRCVTHNLKTKLPSDDEEIISPLELHDLNCNTAAARKSHPGNSASVKVYIVFHEGLNDISRVDHLGTFTHGKVTYLCLSELVRDSSHDCLEHCHRPGFNRRREQPEATIASV